MRVAVIGSRGLYAGEDVKITGTEAAFCNERQRAGIRLGKVLEQDERFDIGMNGEILSVQFGLFAAESLAASDGSVIPAGGLLEIVSCQRKQQSGVPNRYPCGREAVC